MILCIGYGPDSLGRVANRFGPINMEGGERRLNVAITRAKLRMTVVRSMRPTDIRSRSEGARLLRRFLEYVSSPDTALGGEAVLRDYLKTEVATNDDTIREHSSVAASPSSSLPSSHTSQANLDTSRASPMFVRPPSDAPDSVSVLTRRASPLRSAGYAADSRIWRPSRGQWGCHIPYPDTDAEDSALLDEVTQPLLTPVSPPTAWHRGRSLPLPLCSVGHHLHLREYCAWFPASLGRSDCDRLHPPQTGFAH